MCVYLQAFVRDKLNYVGPAGYNIFASSFVCLCVFMPIETACITISVIFKRGSKKCSIRGKFQNELGWETVLFDNIKLLLHVKFEERVWSLICLLSMIIQFSSSFFITWPGFSLQTAEALEIPFPNPAWTLPQLSAMQLDIQRA